MDVAIACSSQHSGPELSKNVPRCPKFREMRKKGSTQNSETYTQKSTGEKLTSLNSAILEGNGPQLLNPNTYSMAADQDRCIVDYPFLDVSRVSMDSVGGLKEDEEKHAAKSKINAEIAFSDPEILR